jgi:hypothetical protein
MRRSTALLRLALAMLLLAAAFQVPALADPTPCDSCFVGGLCQPCEDGGKRPCQVRVCCGVTTITTCGTCTLHCVPPPS